MMHFKGDDTTPPGDENLRFGIAPRWRDPSDAKDADAGRRSSKSHTCARHAGLRRRRARAQRMCEYVRYPPCIERRCTTPFTGIEENVRISLIS